MLAWCEIQWMQCKISQKTERADAKDAKDIDTTSRTVQFSNEIKSGLSHAPFAVSTFINYSS